jgi:hypothetical protein
MNVGCRNKHDERRWLLLWLVDRDRRTLDSNKLADSGSVKLQSTTKATPVVWTQNLACAVYSYSCSAATEI